MTSDQKGSGASVMSNNQPIIIRSFLLASIIVVLMLSRWVLAAPPTFSQQALPSSTGGWEYRILTSRLSDATGVKQGPTTIMSKGKPIIISPAPDPSLEERIKDLADQGFEVDSFQALSAIDAGGNTYTGLSVRSDPELVVLLKRQKSNEQKK